MTVYIVAVTVDEPQNGIEAWVAAKALKDAGLDFGVVYMAAVNRGYSPELLGAFRTLGYSDAEAAYLSGGAAAPNA